MTLDDYFRDEISRGQPPMVALNKAAQNYANSLRSIPVRDGSQYANETEAWDEPQENNEIEMQRRLRTFLHKANPGGCRVFSLGEQCQCPLCDLDRLLSATSKPQDSEAVELLREQCQRMKKDRDNGGCLSSSESAWFYRVMVFLEGKQ